MFWSLIKISFSMNAQKLKKSNFPLFKVCVKTVDSERFKIWLVVFNCPTPIVSYFFDTPLHTAQRFQSGPIAYPTPARTHSISGLKSRVLKLTFFSLKMMVKSGLEFILKLTEPLQSCCCPVQKNLPSRAELACEVSRYLWRGSVILKINSRPLFTIIFKLKKC